MCPFAIAKFSLVHAFWLSLSACGSSENFAIANGHKAFAYDEAYIINAMVDIEDEIEFEADASHAKMRNAFVKGMAKRSMSRTLTNRLVDRIAC